MRWICFLAASLAAFGLMSSAVGIEAVYGGGGTCTSCEQYYTYSAPACAAPFYGFQPGCCERPPSPCDNAWAGYCQEKARGRAFVYGVGTGGGFACDGPTCANCEPTVAVPETPGPSVPTDPAAQLRQPHPPLAPSSRPPIVPRDRTELPRSPTPDLHLPAPPQPSQFSEPKPLPPVTKPLVEETTWRWDYFWRPSGQTPGPQAEWSRLR